MKLPGGCIPKQTYKLLNDFAAWLKIEELRDDAHSPSKFPFKCRRCGAKIKDKSERDRLKAELAALRADKTVAGKKVYSKAIALHADAHCQQMPFQVPIPRDYHVTIIPRDYYSRSRSPRFRRRRTSSTCCTASISTCRRST